MIHLYRRVSSFIHLHSDNSFSRSGDLQWAILGRDQGVHVAISPFRWVEGSYSLIVLRSLDAWVPEPLISFTSLTRFWWRGIWVVESRTRLFHSLSILNDQPHTFWIIHFYDSSISIHHTLSISQDHGLFWKYPWNLSYLWGILALHWSQLSTLVSLCIHCWAILSWQRSTVLVASGDISSTNCAICPSPHSLVAHHAAHDRIQLLCLPCFPNLSLFHSCGPSFW